MCMYVEIYMLFVKSQTNGLDVSSSKLLYHEDDDLKHFHTVNRHLLDIPNNNKTALTS